MTEFDFSGLTTEQLLVRQTSVLAAIDAFLVGGIQSYSMMGRSFTFADLSTLNQMLKGINLALSILAGTAAVRFVCVNVNLER